MEEKGGKCQKTKKRKTKQNKNREAGRQIITGFYAKPACHTSIGVSARWARFSFFSTSLVVVGDEYLCLAGCSLGQIVA